MTRGLGGWLALAEQRNFTSNLLPIWLGALGVLFFFLFFEMGADFGTVNIKRYNLKNIFVEDTLPTIVFKSERI